MSYAKRTIIAISTELLRRGATAAIVCDGVDPHGRAPERISATHP